MLLSTVHFSNQAQRTERSWHHDFQCDLSLSIFNNGGGTLGIYIFIKHINGERVMGHESTVRIFQHVSKWEDKIINGAKIPKDWRPILSRINAAPLLQMPKCTPASTLRGADLSDWNWLTESLGPWEEMSEQSFLSCTKASCAARTQTH